MHLVWCLPGEPLVARQPCGLKNFQSCYGKSPDGCNWETSVQGFSINVARMESNGNQFDEKTG